MTEGNKNKGHIKFWIIIILLIIIILILLYFVRFGKIQNNLVPTGNVDVFDINVNCDCIDKDNDDSLPVFNEDEDKKVLGQVFVNDKNGNYIYQKKLEIFNNAAFEYTNKIAPGSSNTYHFVVHNSTDTKLQYYLQMYEQSEYNINLKYRLKRNNNYIIGNENNWVNVNELKTAFSKINFGTSDSYSLDWKWEYEDGNDIQDTFVGENINSMYELNIRFYFESVEA